MPEPGPPELRAERTTETGGLSWFLAGAASWFTGYGMQGVLFSTLLVVELGEGPARVGAAQSALMVPAVVLILLGGAVADRVDRRRLLIALHVAAAGIVLTLCAVLANGEVEQFRRLVDELGRVFVGDEFRMVDQVLLLLPLIRRKRLLPAHPTPSL